jgi:type VI secretion system protein ImpA
MINVEDLLKPIAGDKPCGEDFTYHPSFQNLQTLALGKPEVQYGSHITPAEEPEWKEVRDAALDVLSQSKHLGAAVILTNALVNLGGLDGLRDGFAVVRGLTEKYWSDVYPRLDPEDNNDPTERLNILNNLSGPKFLNYVSDVVLCSSASLGSFTLRQVIAAKEKAQGKAPGQPAAAANPGPELAQIQAAFREAGAQVAIANLAIVTEMIGHVQGLDKFLDASLGAGRGANFESLKKLVAEMRQTLEPYAVVEAPAEAAGAAGGGAERPAAKPVAGLSGTIQTRADVIKALGLICDFYRQNEPSSPVPLILQRGLRLVDKDFMAIMSDLTPDALKQLQVITGAKPEK